MTYEESNQSEESLLGEHRIPNKWKKSPARRTIWILTFSNVLLFVVSVGLLVERHYGFPQQPKSSWLRESTHYSPLWDTPLEDHLQKTDKQLDGHLFDPPHPSPYRNYLAPNATVEAAWQALESIRTFPITRDAVLKLGKDPTTAVQYPPAYGPGLAGRYVAQLDVFHQLHCLNLLRHAAWGEYARDGVTAGRPFSELHWVHLGHCVEVLRENLVCGAGLDVLTFRWMETQDLPFADFSLRKQCTDIGTLMEWQDEHALPVETSRNFTRPADGDFRETPISDEYFRIYGIGRKVDLHHGEAHEHSYKEDS